MLKYSLCQNNIPGSFSSSLSSIISLGCTTTPSTGHHCPHTQETRRVAQRSAEFITIPQSKTKSSNYRNMYKSYFFLKYLWHVLRYQFQLGPVLSLCNAVSSAVLSQLTAAPPLEEPDTTQPKSPQSLGSCEQALPGAGRNDRHLEAGSRLVGAQTAPELSSHRCAIKSQYSVLTSCGFSSELVALGPFPFVVQKHVCIHQSERC